MPLTTFRGQRASRPNEGHAPPRATAQRRSSTCLTANSCWLLAASGCGRVSSDEPVASGTGGAGGAGGSGGEPADEGGTGGNAAGSSGAAGMGPTGRPIAPPWQPHFDLGRSAWRDSREPLCTMQYPLMNAAVWSDSGEVFALVGASCNALADEPCGSGVGSSLYANSGNGWRSIHTDDSHGENGGLRGFTGGDLILYNNYCGISLMGRDGTGRCSWSDVEFEGVRSAATSGGAGYAIVGQRLLMYEPPGWTEFAATSQEPEALWTGDGSIVVAGARQFVARSDMSGRLTQLPGVPAGNYWSVWAFASEIWLGNTVGQLVRFDGQDWTVIDTGINAPIFGLWGSSTGVRLEWPPPFGCVKTAESRSIGRTRAGYGITKCIMRRSKLPDRRPRFR
jgi:hypothetical protein